MSEITLKQNLIFKTMVGIFIFYSLSFSKFYVSRHTTHLNCHQFWFVFIILYFIAYYQKFILI